MHWTPETIALVSAPQTASDGCEALAVGLDGFLLHPACRWLAPPGPPDIGARGRELGLRRYRRQNRLRHAALCILGLALGATSSCRHAASLGPLRFSTRTRFAERILALVQLPKSRWWIGSGLAVVATAVSAFDRLREDATGFDAPNVRFLLGILIFAGITLAVSYDTLAVLLGILRALRQLPGAIASRLGLRRRRPV